MSANRASFFRMSCPHCGERSIVRSSMTLSKLVRKLIFMCTNYECGHTFTAMLSVETTLSLSAIPDPEVCIPLSDHIRRQIIRGQLELFGGDSKNGPAD
jgi:hypothetical protein